MNSSPCRVEGCQKEIRYKRAQLCGMHYARINRNGNVDLIRKFGRNVCFIEGCNREIHGNEMCQTHYMRERRGHEVAAPINTPAPKGEGHISKYGYRVINGKVLEHRAVMAAALDRDLIKNETVHHMNGNRLDNRIENLELWSSAQPSGQRVKDKVDFAIQILALYAPEALA